jgi:hypothetical protein
MRDEEKQNTESRSQKSELKQRAILNLFILTSVFWILSPVSCFSSLIPLPSSLLLVDRLRLALSLLACRASVQLSTPAALFVRFGPGRRIPTSATSSQDLDALSLHHTRMEKLFGEPGRIRTFDPLLKRQVP